MNNQKTNNSFLIDKIMLRANHLPDNPVVLNCFAGEDLIWCGVELKAGKKIPRLNIDKKSYGDFYIPGDCIGYLETLDLNKYSVIDLDSYGIPFKELQVLVKRKYKGTIFVTFIQSIIGVLPTELLLSQGITEKMINKIPTAYYKSGWKYFLNYLSSAGVTEIVQRTKDRKHYICFHLC